MSGRKIGLLIGASTGLIVGVAWYFVGGLPQNHDAYGKLPVGFAQQGDVPSQIPKNIDPANLPEIFNQTQQNIERKRRRERRRVEFPEGEVRLNWEGSVTGSGDTRSVSDPPDDLFVVVRPADGGEPLETEKSGGYESIVGDKGWTSWRKVEIPEDGNYFVAAVSPSGDAGKLALGKAFWNPGGSRVLGAILALLACLAITFLIIAAISGLRRKTS
jgi:hypothetical protein